MNQSQNLLGWGYGDEDSVSSIWNNLFTGKLSADQDDSDGQFHTGFYLFTGRGSKDEQNGVAS